MGIFSSIKKWFSKEIILDQKSLNSLVIPYKFKGGKLKLKTPIDVPPNFAFVLGHQGKVLDIFPTGKYTIDYVLIPNCCKRFKLNKPLPDGSFVNKFKVDGYYINLLSFTNEWKSYRKMEFLDSEKGIFKATAKGYFSYKINDVGIFVKSLFLELAYLKKGEAEKLVSNWTVEYLTHRIEKKNYSLQILTDDLQSVNQAIFIDFAKKFVTYGLKIDEFEITDFSLTKRYQNLIVKALDVDLNKINVQTKNLPQPSGTIEQQEIKLTEPNFKNDLYVQADLNENRVVNKEPKHISINEIINNKSTQSVWGGIEEVKKCLDEQGNISISDNLNVSSQNYKSINNEYLSNGNNYDYSNIYQKNSTKNYFSKGDDSPSDFVDLD